MLHQPLLSPERRSPEPQWNDRIPQEEPPFTVHRASNLEQTQRGNDFARGGDVRTGDVRQTDTPRQRPAAEPAALVIGELNPDPVSCECSFENNDATT